VFSYCVCTVEAEITLAEDGATVTFADYYGNPVKFAAPRQERGAIIKALRAAAAEQRRKGEAVGERDLVKLYQRNAERLEKELARLETK
jgi:outer membrane lipopolysaccharide assembly protein LptE/RlpB